MMVDHSLSAVDDAVILVLVHAIDAAFARYIRLTTACNIQQPLPIVYNKKHHFFRQTTQK